MKLAIASTIGAVVLAEPQAPQLGQGPSARFTSKDIREMIAQMGATGEAATALYKQFAGLDGYKALQASNAVGTVAGFNGIAGGYGCWCYFGDKHLERKAKGQPLDDLDSMCHTLSRGYECATIDLNSCTPWDTDYLHADDIDAIGNFPADIATMCEVENGNADSCEYMACTVEQWWMKQVKIHPNGGATLANLIDAANKHNDAGWEARREALCVGPSVGSDRQLECCGVYPERYPFNSLAPNKRCCEDATGASPVQTMVYNTAYEQCCTDGAVLGFGDSC